MVKNMNIQKNNLGFTLVEVMMVLVIIVILATIAVPTYQSYTIKTKRTQMMTDLQGLASEISKQKVTQGSYRNINENNVFPKDSSNQPMKEFPTTDSTKLYTVTIADLSTGKWTLTATPKQDSMMEGDGNLSLNYDGYKCHKTKCGRGDEWKQ